MVLIDLFYNDLQLTAQEVQTLKTKANGAKRLVIAYMNIGSAEKYRYYWQKNWRQYSPKWLKKKYPGYKDELYVEFWNQEWKDIIYGNDNSYAKRILNADFDGVYLDNVEAFYVLYHSN
jgi:cysteinyl-tRNA synthetase